LDYIINKNPDDILNIMDDIPHPPNDQIPVIPHPPNDQITVISHPPNDQITVISHPPNDQIPVISHPPNTIRTVLHFAAARGEIEMIKRIFLENSESSILHAVDENGWQPIHEGYNNNNNNNNNKKCDVSYLLLFIIYIA
jgi:ankyrin repeat protein